MAKRLSGLSCMVGCEGYHTLRKRDHPQRLGVHLENFQLADLYAAVTCLVLNSSLLFGSIAILRVYDGPPRQCWAVVKFTVAMLHVSVGCTFQQRISRNNKKHNVVFRATNKALMNPSSPTSMAAGQTPMSMRHQEK